MPSSANTGLYSLDQLLAVINQSAAAFGVDRVQASLDADLASHNRIVREDLLPELCDTTADRQRVSGISTATEMMEVDQLGRAPTQVEPTPGSLGFPLRLFQRNTGWTDKYRQLATPADFAREQIGREVAHLRSIRKAIQRAFFLSANYTFPDRLVDKVTLNVKRLANADGFTIPNGPNGETFNAATHSHYLAEAALSASGLLSAVNTVVEHEVAGPIRIGISATDEAAVRALAGFTATADPRLLLATNANQADRRLDITRLNDRLIGYFGAAEVWVKPWAVANYAVVYDAGPGAKPLAFRQRSQETLQGLRLAGTNSLYPLTAQFYEAEFGVGVWNRTKMAVYYFAGGAYTDPNI
jgi:hypothetical protein